MEKTVMDIRKALIEMPLNSITYLEIPEEAGNRLELDRIKLMALDTFCRSYIREFGQPDESNITWQEIVEEYTKTHARYISAIYIQLRQKLGDDIVVLLSETCWQLGYEAVQRSIYLYKTCPKVKKKSSVCSSFLYERNF